MQLFLQTITTMIVLMSIGQCVASQPSAADLAELEPSSMVAIVH